MIDTSILIDYFRKSDKANSRLIAHFKQYNQLYISSITAFEVYNGAAESLKQFWEEMRLRLIILDFDGKAAIKAAEIVGQLKAKRKTIDKPDLFIAATATVCQNLNRMKIRMHRTNKSTPFLLQKQKKFLKMRMR